MTQLLPARSRQRGVTLIVALVMLVVIGFLSVSLMRGVLTGDTVANNLRVQNFAMQQAQAGLRYCESFINATPAQHTDAQAKGADVPIPPQAPVDDASYNWKKFASWHGAGVVATRLPDDWMNSSDANMSQQESGKVRPQCMVERLVMPPPQQPFYLVTARGFSWDYSEDNDGRATSGSVVWLQSIVAM